MIRQHTPLALSVGYDVPGMGHAAVQAVADAVDGNLCGQANVQEALLFTLDTVLPAGKSAD